MLEYVDEVRAWFDALINEGQFSWLTEAQRRLALKLAYAEYRRHVARCDPYLYATTADITVTAAYEYDLANAAVTILGESPTNTRMVRLLLLGRLNSDGRITGIYRNAADFDAVAIALPPEDIDVVGGFHLTGTKLVFDSRVTSTLRVWYVPESAVDWSNDTGAAPREWIDDTVQFHELIPLLAYANYYGLRDGVVPPHIERRKDALLGEMYQSLAVERQDGGYRVRDTFFAGRF